MTPFASKKKKLQPGDLFFFAFLFQWKIASFMLKLNSRGPEIAGAYANTLSSSARQTGTVSSEELQDAFKKSIMILLRVPLLSCLATELWLCGTFKCQMKYICDPKATRIAF